MSPPQSNPPSGRALHSRNSSNAAATKADCKPSKRAATLPQPEVHFTALIRLPFPRGDFVDPPQVDWDASKDKALWKIISRSPKTGDLDWEELASKFQVPHTFMLQQAAWLYERHLSHVRAQMRKVGGTNPNSGLPSNPTIPVGGYAMKRLGSGGSRAPSALSIRSKDSSKPEPSVPGTPRAAPLSRSPSTNTVTQSRPPIPPSSPRQALHRSFRAPLPPGRKTSPAVTSALASNNINRPSSPSSPSAAGELSSSSSTTSSDDDDPNPIRRSKIFKRPPRFKQHKSTLSRLDQSAREDDEDAGESSDNDDSNTFLPFANPGVGRGHDPTATLRQTRRQDPSSPQASEPPSYTTGPETAGPANATSPSAFTFPSRVPRIGGNIPPTDSSASSTSSAAPTGVFANFRTHSSPGQRTGVVGRGSGPLSPRHRAELARLNPHKRHSVTSISSAGSGGGPASGGNGKGKEAEKSDGGTPSMGSSFSDLDDTSVTQSALEEALLSNMQHGRMSTFSSLRSRLL